MRKLVAACILVSLTALPLSPIHSILQARHQSISKAYLQEITFPSPTSEAGNIVYGNRQYGYFSLDEYKRSGGEIRFALVPPGYRFPIEFYFRGTHFNYLGSRRFENPTPLSFLPLSGRVKGVFSTPYVLMGNGVAIPTDGSDLSKPIQLQATVILNRYGEIVWLHLPVPGAQFSTQEITAKPMGHGRYALLVHHDHLEVVDYRGNVSHNIRFSSGESRLGLHHDFEVLDPDHIIAIGSEYHFVRLLHPILPRLLDEDGTVYQRTSLFSRPRRFRVDTIQKVDLITDKISPPLWNSLGVTAPVRVEETLKYLPLDGVGTAELSHANRLQVIPNKGYLISLSAQSRIVYLDTQFRIQWTLGSSAHDTYRFLPPQIPFRGQHHPTLIGPNKILLFDNLGDNGQSRILKLSLGAPPLVTVEQILRPSPSIRSRTRGSAFLLPDQNTLAFFASPCDPRDPQKSLDDVLIEFDEHGKEVARMEIDNPFDSDHADGYTAQPLEVIGKEEPMDPLLASKLVSTRLMALSVVP